MSEEINLNKTVFNKTQYSKIINTSFNELGVTSISDELANQPTVEEFFSLYNQLFYNIPELGEINSHQYLIKKSSDYINFDENSEIIEELQKEITQLRTELLDSQKQVIELETGTSLDTQSISNPTPSITSGNVSTSGTSGTGGGGGGGGGGY
tara:strand:+ start:158 stop:616 length:459 start_codon:yes stop_codon:yes gene_type:complete